MSEKASSMPNTGLGQWIDGRQIVTAADAHDFLSDCIREIDEECGSGEFSERKEFRAYVGVDGEWMFCMEVAQQLDKLLWLADGLAELTSEELRERIEEAELREQEGA